jgi:hypothetical protein
VCPDAHIANHKRAAPGCASPKRAQRTAFLPNVDLRSKRRERWERQKPWEPSVHPRQIHNRGKHTINQEFLTSGLHGGMLVILAESWRCFFSSHTPILRDDFPQLAPGCANLAQREPKTVDASRTCDSRKRPHFPSPTSMSGPFWRSRVCDKRTTVARGLPRSVNTERALRIRRALKRTLLDTPFKESTTWQPPTSRPTKLLKYLGS